MLLSKLDWDMCAVIASDFTEHIIQRVRKIHLGMSVELVRRHSETLITMCASHFAFASLAPSVVASAAVITTIRPALEAVAMPLEMPSPSTSSTSSPNKPITADLEQVLDEVERITQIHKVITR